MAKKVLSEQELTNLITKAVIDELANTSINEGKVKNAVKSIGKLGKKISNSKLGKKASNSKPVKAIKNYLNSLTNKNNKAAYKTGVEAIKNNEKVAKDFKDISQREKNAQQYFDKINDDIKNTYSRMQELQTQVLKNGHGDDAIAHANTQMRDEYYRLEDKLKNLQDEKLPQAKELLAKARDEAQAAKIKADKAYNKKISAHNNYLKTVDKTNKTRAATAGVASALAAGGVGYALGNHHGKNVSVQNDAENSINLNAPAPGAYEDGIMEPGTNVLPGASSNNNSTVERQTEVSGTTPVERQPLMPDVSAKAKAALAPNNVLQTPQTAGLVPRKEPALANPTAQQQRKLNRQNNRLTNAVSNGDIDRQQKLAQKMAQTAGDTNLRNQLDDRFKSAGLYESVDKMKNLMERMSKTGGNKGSILL